MKTESAVRVVTLGKIKRDAENMRQYARFSIVLEGGVPRVIDNGHLFRTGQPFAHLVAVLGPVRHQGVLVDQAVLLEIGYFRTRPYMQLEERKRSGDGRWFLKDRVRVRKISDHELRVAYPLIEQCLAQIVLERRETWKPESREKRYLKSGAGWVERGLYCTVDKSDRLLYRQVLAEDIWYRREKYIRWHVWCINRWIGHYKLGKSDKQIRGLTGVSKAAELIASKNYHNPAYRRALVETFPVNSRARLLLERMDSIFSLRLEEENDDTRLLRRLQAVALKPFQSIHCRIVDQPKVHAKGAVVLEVILERKFREQNEVPF